MKRIYFVRHGESESNANDLHGHALHPLTEKGHQQAAFVAERCAKLPIEMIISSTMTRARETTDAILKKVALEPEYSDLFVEAQPPSVFRGKPRNDPELAAFQEEINSHFGVEGYRFSDEDTFDDLKLRAGKALDYLASIEKEHILVVTHGYFLRVIVAYALFGPTLTAHEGKKFIRALHMENTGLSILGYSEGKEEPWWVWVWNDHAHLG